MIIVDISAGVSDPLEVRRLAVGDWQLDIELPEGERELLAISAGRVVGAFHVLSSWRLTDDRVRFRLCESPRLAFYLGRTAPEPLRGGGGHARLVDAEAVLSLAMGRSGDLAARRRRSGVRVDKRESAAE